MRALRPDSISAMRARRRQTRLVGKLMIHRGWVRRWKTHVAWLDLAMLAGSDVGIIVVGECLTKMQRDTFSHDADSIDGIDQSVGARVENVAGDVLDHNVSNTNFSEP